MVTSPRRALVVAVAALVTAAVGAATTSAPAAGATRTCGKPGYSYAGYQSASRAHGVRATLRVVAAPAVENGHVAAWVGMGGPGQGPNGSDAWLQIGLSAFSWEKGSRLYYEVNRPGVGPVYKEVVTGVAPGRRYRVAVLETVRRDWWRVWVNGKPVSPPLHLRGSSGRWRPIATAETWDGGRRACNRFAYGFEHVSIAGGRGGGWRTFRSGHRFLDSGYRVLASRGGGTFLARTAIMPPAPVKNRPKPVLASAPAAAARPATTATAPARPVEHPLEALSAAPDAAAQPAAEAVSDPAVEVVAPQEPAPVAAEGVLAAETTTG